MFFRKMFCMCIHKMHRRMRVHIQCSGHGYFFTTNGYMYFCIFKCTNACRNDVAEQVI